MTEQDKALYEYYRSIPVGKEYATSRSTLCRQWNTNDRTVRNIISEIRLNCRRLAMAYFVVSDSHGKGYWRTSDKQEIRAFNEQMMSRVNNIIPAVQNASKYLQDVQTDLFGGMY